MTVTVGVIEVDGKVRHSDAWLRTTPAKALAYLRGRAKKSTRWYAPEWRRNLSAQQRVVLKVYQLLLDGPPALITVTQEGQHAG